METIEFNTKDLEFVSYIVKEHSEPTCKYYDNYKLYYDNYHIHPYTETIISNEFIDLICNTYPYYLYIENIKDFYAKLYIFFNDTVINYIKDNIIEFMYHFKNNIKDKEVLDYVLKCLTDSRF